MASAVRRITPSARLMLPLILSVACLADTVAVTPAGGTAGADSRPFVIGWEFSVSTTITVTGLAYLDATGAGLSEAHMVGIFDEASGNLLVSATVEPGSNTIATNGFRVAPVAYKLNPGTYVIGGLKPTGADYAEVRATTVVNVPGVSYIQERELQTSTFTMPTTNFTNDEIGSFGPSFTVASGAGVPVITGIANSGSYQPSFASNTYLSIFGQNLSATTRTWTASDFTNGTQLPTSLDGVTVTINGTAAYVEYVSPTQVNIIAPNIAATGQGIPVSINLRGQQGAGSWIAVQNTAPAFFTWQTGTSNSGKYVVAQHTDYTNAGMTGLFPNMPSSYTTPVRPGETIILYGTGFGPTNPAISPGIVTDKIYPISPAPTASVANLPAQVQFAGLIPSLAQVYQINLTIPAGTPSGDVTIAVSANGGPPAVGLLTVSP